MSDPARLLDTATAGLELELLRSALGEVPPAALRSSVLGAIAGTLSGSAALSGIAGGMPGGAASMAPGTAATAAGGAGTASAGAAGAAAGGSAGLGGGGFSLGSQLVAAVKVASAGKAAFVLAASMGAATAVAVNHQVPAAHAPASSVVVATVARPGPAAMAPPARLEPVPPAAAARSALEAAPVAASTDKQPALARKGKPSRAARAAAARRSGDWLEQQLVLVAAALDAIHAGDSEQALRVLNEYSRRFESGALGPEVDLLRSEALAQLRAVGKLPVPVPARSVDSAGRAPLEVRDEDRTSERRPQ